MFILAMLVTGRIVATTPMDEAACIDLKRKAERQGIVAACLSIDAQPAPEIGIADINGKLAPVIMLPK